MSDYADILRALVESSMKQGLLPGGWGNPTNTTQAEPTPENTLTAEKLFKMAASVAALGPAAGSGVDLYPHDLADQEQAFIVDRSQILGKMYAGRSSWMRRFVEHAGVDRKMVIVPRARLVETFQQMQANGLDVRLYPRYGNAPPREDRFKADTEGKAP